MHCYRWKSFVTNFKTHLSIEETAKNREHFTEAIILNLRKLNFVSSLNFHSNEFIFWEYTQNLIKIAFHTIIQNRFPHSKVLALPGHNAIGCNVRMLPVLLLPEEHPNVKK